MQFCGLLPSGSGRKDLAGTVHNTFSLVLVKRLGQGMCAIANRIIWGSGYTDQSYCIFVHVRGQLEHTRLCLITNETLLRRHRYTVASSKNWGNEILQIEASQGRAMLSYFNAKTKGKKNIHHLTAVTLKAWLLHKPCQTRALKHYRNSLSP